MISTKSVEIDNFLSFFIETLTFSKDSSKTILIINDYIKRRLKLEGSCILFADKDKKNEFDVIEKSLSFPNLSHFGATQNDKRVVVKEKGIIAEVLHCQKPLSLSYQDISEILSTSLLNNCQSIFIIPFFLFGNLVGVFFFTQSKKKKFEPYTTSFLKNYASYLILAKNYLHSYTSFKDREGLKKELQIARQLQTKLMPLGIPNLGDFNLVAMNRSAKDVSGDFYDFIDIDVNRTLIIIGDASGKGVPACIIGIMARSIIRSLSVYFESLEDLLMRLNKSLFEDLERNRFITIAFAFIDKKHKIIECARAGHTSILLKNSQNKIIDIKPKGVAVGLLPPKNATIFETFSMVFSRGSEMILFSDGLVEQTNDKDDEFTLDQLKESWLKNDENYDSLTDVADGILNDIEVYANGTTIQDDQTIILISRT